MNSNILIKNANCNCMKINIFKITHTCIYTYIHTIYIYRYDIFHMGGGGLYVSVSVGGRGGIFGMQPKY